MEKIELKHIIIHKVAKEQGKKKETAKISFGDAVIDATDKAAILFVNEFYKANTRKSGLQYGTFTEKANLKKIIGEYDKNISSENFYILSKKIAESYKEELVSAATGGYLIIFQYDDKTIGNNNKPKGTIFAIAILKDKETTGITSNLKFTSSYTLDIDIMDLATTIMIDRYLDKESQLNHLTFMTGLKDLADYFKIGFIGCTNVKKSTIATREFMKAIEDFAKEKKGYKEEQIKPIRKKLIPYFETHKNEVIVKDMLNLAFPEESDQKEFDKFVEEKKLEISASFKPNNSVLVKWKKFSVHHNGISLEFSQKKIKDKIIQYDKKSNRIYIKDDDKIFYNEFIKFTSEKETNNEIE
ncbi:MAG: nucleoid-associated protein [Pleomorphochaeta sp.]